MPWHISKGGGTCGASQWAVLKDADGSTAGCHDSEDDAKAQLAALYANEEHMNAATDLADLRAAAAEARRAAAQRRDALPAGIAWRNDEDAPRPRFASSFKRAQPVERDGQQWILVEGVASAFERGYEMWDLFGPYTEIVSRTAASGCYGERGSDSATEAYPGTGACPGHTVDLGPDSKAVATSSAPCAHRLASNARLFKAVRFSPKFR